MKNTLKIVSVIIGTLIGAGFASGKEIYIFFAKYGILGIMGILISAVITGAITYKVLKIVKQNQINNYKQLLEQINPKGHKINKIINIIVNAFLLTSFFIMIAGFSAYIKQTFKINTYISSTVFVAICYIILRQNIKGVIKINEILVPLLIIFIIYLGIKNLGYISEATMPQIVAENGIKDIIASILSSILYASYNSIILIPILANFGTYIKEEKTIKKVAIITVIVIVVLALLIYGLLLRGINYASELEMPLIQIVKEFGNICKLIYEFVIIVSIYTSAISTGYSVLENTKQDTKKYTKQYIKQNTKENIKQYIKPDTKQNIKQKEKQNKKIVLILMCITGIIISNIGFSKLVQILYPLFGILGLVQIYKVGRSKSGQKCPKRDRSM